MSGRNDEFDAQLAETGDDRPGLDDLVDNDYSALLATDDLDEDDDEEAEEPYVSFGSSVGLQRELAELENLLKQAGVSSSSPAYRCLRVLREAADQSVASDLPIIVW